MNRTAAVEYVLGLVARSFMAAEVRPALPALTPLTLSMIARQTIGLGNAVFQINSDVLVPVVSYSIAGNADPESWRYSVKLPFPNGDNPKDPEDLPVTVLPATRVLHVRYMPRPSAPWHGVAPLTAAGLTASQLAKIEQSLEYDASLPTGGILPMPDGVAPATVTKAGIALSDGKGKIGLLETTAQGMGQGTTAAPKGDWEQKRFGAMIPASSIEAREKALESVLEAMGVPSAMHRSNGAALRESFRHFNAVTIEPLAELIATELSEKYGRDIDNDVPTGGQERHIGALPGVLISRQGRHGPQGRGPYLGAADGLRDGGTGARARAQREWRGRHPVRRSTRMGHRECAGAVDGLDHTICCVLRFTTDTT